MSEDQNLNINELDAEKIILKFREFLENNTEFTDYDFEGSNLSAIMNLLSYDSHYQAFYAHMLYNESFLDTAVKRSSVVSRAKSLNYTPRSITAATAYIDVFIIPDNTPNKINIPKYTKFRSSIDGEDLNFVTTQDYEANYTGSGNTFSATDIKIVQGDKKSISFIVNAQDEDQNFVLPYSDIDTSHLEVSVQKSFNDTTTEFFTPVQSFIDLDRNSKVYFLQETDNGNFEIYFGDDILGKGLRTGNIINVNYIRTKGPIANKANTFTIRDSVETYSNITVETKSVAMGGKSVETKNSIRNMAPRFAESQERAVTAEDYKTLLLKNNTLIQENFDSVSTWGGEDNDPVSYGNIFISLKPKNNVFLTEFIKNRIKSEILDKAKMVGIIPVIVDPEYLYLEMDISFEYSRNKTQNTPNELIQKVKKTLLDYKNENLAFFDKNFKYSTISKMIDNSDTSIQNNLINLTLRKNIEVQINRNYAYETNFNNSLKEGEFYSSDFYVFENGQSPEDVYFFKDDEKENVNLHKIQIDNKEKIVKRNVGTINYNTGKVSINSIVIQNLLGSSVLKFYAKPKINNINSVRNLILTFDENDLNIEATGISG